MLGGNPVSRISITYDLEGLTNDTKKVKREFRKSSLGKYLIKEGYLIYKVTFLLTAELACFPISRFKIEIN